TFSKGSKFIPYSESPYSESPYSESPYSKSSYSESISYIDDESENLTIPDFSV
ncbi:16439_t:CDS:1, partial [Cetraspora pellucida]